VLVAGPLPPATEVAVGSNYIVWTQRSGGQSDVWAFDLLNLGRVQVTLTAGSDESQPATSGPWITWQKQDHGATTASIEAMNPSNWDMRSIVVNDSYNLRPSIDGDLIAWESLVTGNYEIFLYRLSSGETFLLNPYPTPNKWLWLFRGFNTPVSSATLERTFDAPLNLAGCNAVKIDVELSAQQIQLRLHKTDGTYSTAQVDVSGLNQYEWSTVTLPRADFDDPSYGYVDQIQLVITARPNAQVDYDSYFDNLRCDTGLVIDDFNGYTLTSLRQVWGTPTSNFTVFLRGWPDKYLNDVFGNKVVYVDLRNGSQDIYLASFNKSPLANAGADQTAHPGRLVTLDGSASTDPDLNYPLTYAWTLKRPAGSAAALIGAGTATPSFTPDVMGDYVAELVVTDAEDWPSLPDAVKISTKNTAPVAAAGDDQSLILLGSTVQLNGSTSYDTDGDAITFLWSFTSRPGGSAAALSDPTAAKPTFVADLYGKYELSLTVTDPFGANATDTVIVSFENVKPVANAGANQAVVAPSTVLLDGTASSDANGDPLTYQWNMVSKPDGSSAVLSNSETAHPSFVADRAGQYVVSLTVSDGLLASDPSNVTITATFGSTAVIDVLRDTVNAINGLAPASFKNPNMANALTNKIAAMIQMIERGNYAEALDKVNNDILAKTNGCATAGASDKNDWITDCATQAQVYPYLIEVMTMLQQMVP
jgi:hypothetical protein